VPELQVVVVSRPIHHTGCSVDELGRRAGWGCVRESLNVAAAIPSAAMMGGACSRATTALMHNIDAQQSRHKEENARQKRKRQIGLELIARPLIGDVAPVPDGAAIHGPDEVGEQAERHHEEGEEDEVHGPVDEGGCEWEEEQQCEEYADCGDDFGVDEAFLGGRGCVLLRVEELARQAGDGG